MPIYTSLLAASLLVIDPGAAVSCNSFGANGFPQLSFSPYTQVYGDNNDHSLHRGSGR